MTSDLLWEDASDENQGRPALRWHSDDWITEPFPDCADDMVGIGVYYGKTPHGDWAVMIQFDNEMHPASRRMPGLTEDEAKERATVLAGAVRHVWRGVSDG